MFGDLNANTMTVAVDSDIILTTEDNVQQFTQLMDHVGTTTEEPLPESVLLQLEQEREEREGKRVDDADVAEATTEGSAKATKAGKSTTTKSMFNLTTTTAATTKTTTTSPGFRAITNPDNEARLRGGMEAIVEQTTSNFGDNFDGSAGMTTFIPQGEEFYSEAPTVDLFVSTEKPDLLREEQSSPLSVSVSMRSQQAEQNEFHSGSQQMEQSTWFPDLAYLVESTLQPDLRIRTSESTDDSSSTTELPNITTNNDVEETRTEIVTELPKLLQLLDQSTTSTTPRLSITTEVATTELPSTTSEQAEATTLPATTTVATAKLQQMVDTTSTSTTTPAPTEATTVAEMAEIVSTIAAPQQQAQLEAIATTVGLVDIPPTPEASTAAPPLPTTTTSSSSSPPLQVVPLTRAPRVERIFNSDGVEVLYGYSSVVRTNHA